MHHCHSLSDLLAITSPSRDAAFRSFGKLPIPRQVVQRERASRPRKGSVHVRFIKLPVAVGSSGKMSKAWEVGRIFFSKGSMNDEAATEDLHDPGSCRAADTKAQVRGIHPYRFQPQPQGIAARLRSPSLLGSRPSAIPATGQKYCLYRQKDPAGGCCILKRRDLHIHKGNGRVMTTHKMHPTNGKLQLPICYALQALLPEDLKNLPCSCQIGAATCLSSGAPPVWPAVFYGIGMMSS
ncbi:MAG: hypothetical protein Q9170_000300 [Blastenia crenularia]